MRLPAFSRVLPAFIRLGDLLVPKTHQVALRTFPGFDDQGRELIRALNERGVEHLVWLVEGKTPPQPPLGTEAASVRRISPRTVKGVFALWRSSVVIHTHGFFKSYRPSPRKTCLNLWHGMPIKRLDPGDDVGRFQTDITIATSTLHAKNLAETWGLRPDQVKITGLPRNDALVRAADRHVPPKLARLLKGRRLVVWLPTYRQAVFGRIRIDGVDEGNVFQIPGGTPELVNKLAASLDIHLIVKSHPMAPIPQNGSLSNLDVWLDADLASMDLTLYELLGHAELLITDHSSVWVDYLLIDRPIVFAISDLEEYGRTRGYYFSPLRDTLPGPLVDNLSALQIELRKALFGRDEWDEHRNRALSMHHLNADGSSAERVAQLVTHILMEEGQ